MSIDTNGLLEVFGLTGIKEVRVRENKQDGSSVIVVVDGQQASVSPNEARYLADRLHYLADKVEARGVQRASNVRLGVQQ